MDDIFDHIMKSPPPKPKNTSNMTGDEVVQVYLAHVKAPVKVPIRSLVEFQRISLEPGEEKQISFTLPPDVFAVFNDDGKKEILAGNYEIFVGGGQPQTKASKATTPGLQATVVVAR